MADETKLTANQLRAVAELPEEVKDFAKRYFETMNIEPSSSEVLWYQRDMSSKFIEYLINLCINQAREIKASKGQWHNK